MKKTKNRSEVRHSRLSAALSSYPTRVSKTLTHEKKRKKPGGGIAEKRLLVNREEAYVDSKGKKRELSWKEAARHDVLGEKRRSQANLPKKNKQEKDAPGDKVGLG